MATAQELINDANDFPDDELELGLVVNAPVDVPPDDAPAPANDEQPSTPEDVPSAGVCTDTLTAGLAHSGESMRHCLWTVVPGVLCIVGGAFASHPAVSVVAVAVGGVLCGLGCTAGYCGEVVAKHVETIADALARDDADAADDDIHAPSSDSAAEKQP